MNAVFRPRLFYLIASIGVFVLFTSLILMAIFKAHQIMQDRRRIVAGCFFLPFVVFMEGASIYGFVGYFRERLELRDGEIIFRGVWREKRIRLEDVTDIRWRSRPVCGSVVLRGVSERIVITFDNFTPPERKRILEFLKTYSASRNAR